MMKVIWMTSPRQSPARDDHTDGRTAAVPRPGFLRSFSFAGQGVWYVVRTQRNMRVHLAAAVCAVAAGLVLRIGAADWACVIITIGVVLAAEALNTVVEALTDLCTTEFHPLAKIAKDAAAGAVLIVSVAAVGVAVAVFLPRLLTLAA
jgi:diacylglycerol kinase (ATP)